jgi:cephalosporin hydroxylase
VTDDNFQLERRAYREALAADADVQRTARDFIQAVNPNHYSYNFDWLGLPIIQYPADIVAVQELIWRVKPRVIVETGVARGGSLALSASILELIGGDGFVIGVEVDLRDHNRRALAEHPLSKRISIVDGSSIDPETITRVRDMVGDRSPVLVFLDSNHTYEHVLAELDAYSPLVARGSYVVVFDTVVENLSADDFVGRPWAPGNSPMTAADEFLARSDCRFVIDEEFDAKLAITVAPRGYLRCVR